MPAISVGKHKFASRRDVLRNVKARLKKSVQAAATATLSADDAAFFKALLCTHYPCFKRSVLGEGTLRYFEVRKNRCAAHTPHLVATVETQVHLFPTQLNADCTSGLWRTRLKTIEIDLDLLFKSVDPRVRQLDEALERAVSAQRLQFFQCVSKHVQVRCAETNVVLPTYKHAHVAYKDAAQSIATLRQAYLDFRAITYDVLPLRALFAPGTKSACVWVLDDADIERDWQAFHLEHATFKIISEAQWERCQAAAAK